MSPIERAVNLWLEHCKQAGHKPQTEGGKATYQFSPYTNRVFCCAHGCTWKASIQVEEEA